jgi:hypothetical protein
MKSACAWFAITVLSPAAVLAQETPPAPPAEEPAVQSEQSSTPTMDHLELDPTSIIGNRELPKVMVIVPWKRAEIGDLQGRPANSLLNEILSPVDRDVFRRELRYFEAIDADQTPEPAPADVTEGVTPAQPET